MTPARLVKLKAVLNRRQPDLSVLLANVHKPRNLSAILRTGHAGGVLQVHAVWPDPRYGPHRHTSGGAGKWVKVRTHANLAAAFEHLTSEGLQILAASLTSNALDFRRVDYTRPTAVVFGAELTGISHETMKRANEAFFVPMMGIVLCPGGFDRFRATQSRHTF